MPSRCRSKLTFIVPNYHGFVNLLESYDIPDRSTLIISRNIGEKASNLSKFIKIYLKHVNTKEIICLNPKGFKTKLFYIYTILFSRLRAILNKKTDDLVIYGFSPVQLFCAANLSNNCNIEYLPFLEKYYPMSKIKELSLSKIFYLKIVKIISGLEVEYCQSINGKVWICVSSSWLKKKYKFETITKESSSNKLKLIIDIKDSADESVAVLFDGPLEAYIGVNHQKSFENVNLYFEKKNIKKIYVKRHPGYHFARNYLRTDKFEIDELSNDIPGEFFLKIFKNKYYFYGALGSHSNCEINSLLGILDYQDNKFKYKYMEYLRMSSGDNYKNITLSILNK